MKTFRLAANIAFDAEDIDDAFRKLAEHFENLADGRESDLIKAGEIELKPD